MRAVEQSMLLKMVSYRGPQEDLSILHATCETTVTKLNMVIDRFVPDEFKTLRQIYRQSGPDALSKILTSDKQYNVPDASAVRTRINLVTNDVKQFVKSYIPKILNEPNKHFVLDLLGALRSLQNYVDQSKITEAEQKVTEIMTTAGIMINLGTVAFEADDNVTVAGKRGVVWCVSSPIIAVQMEDGARLLSHTYFVKKLPEKTREEPDEKET